MYKLLGLRLGLISAVKTFSLLTLNLDKSLGLHSLRPVTLGLPLLRNGDPWTRFSENLDKSLVLLSLRDGDPWIGFSEPGQVPWATLIKG